MAKRSDVRALVFKHMKRDYRSLSSSTFERDVEDLVSEIGKTNELQEANRQLLAVSITGENT
jgi:hypothetical protein